MTESVEHQNSAEPTLEDPGPPIPSVESSISPSIPSVDDQDHVSTTARDLSGVWGYN